MEITIEWLREKKACEEHVALFEQTFGDSAELTRANLLKAGEAGLDLDWLAILIVDEHSLANYYAATDPAMDAYSAADALAWDAYLAAVGREGTTEEEDLAAYRAAEAAAWATHVGAVAAHTLADILGLP